MAQENKIVILGPNYPGLIEPGGQGRYQQHLKAAIEGQGFIVEERVLPVKRALLSFLDQGGDCIYSMTLPVQAAGKPDKMIQSPVLTNVKMFVFQRKGNPPVISIGKLPEKTRIGGVLGNEAYYKESEKSGHILEYVTEDYLNVEKLRYKRLSYIYGFFPNLDLYRSELSFNEKKPILEIPDSITCYENPRTKEFMAILNRRLKPVVESDFQIQQKTETEKVKQRKILALTDLLTDVLPPPLFIIESHLLSLQIVQEAKQKLPNQKRIATLQAAAAARLSGEIPHRQNTGFNQRWKYWKNEFSAVADWTDIWNAFEKEALPSAQKYFEIQEKEFFPAIQTQNYSLAEKIYLEKLVPAYGQHRVQIDGIVAKILAYETQKKDSAEKSLILKTFLMDVFPPPLYLVEPFLILNRIFYASEQPASVRMDNVGQLAMAHRALEGEDDEIFESTGYRTRMAFWRLQKRTILKDEVEIMTKLEKTFQQGDRYFRLVNKNVLPELQKKNEIRLGLRFKPELTSLFQEHEMAVDELSALIRKRLIVLKAKP